MSGPKQELADAIFWNAVCTRAELNGFKPALSNPAVNGFGMNARPFRYFGHGQEVPGIPGSYLQD
jgi:hypothetical protein